MLLTPKKIRFILCFGDLHQSRFYSAAAETVFALLSRSHLTVAFFLLLLAGFLLAERTHAPLFCFRVSSYISSSVKSSSASS